MKSNYMTQNSGDYKPRKEEKLNYNLRRNDFFLINLNRYINEAC